MTKKNIAKSVRLTQEVFDYIDSAPGNGFNEKFKNIILEAKRGESDRKKELARLDARIEQQQRKVYLLFEQYDVLKNFFKDAISVQHSLGRLKSQIQGAVDLEKRIDGGNEDEQI